jgi:hypothetical protein
MTRGDDFGARFRSPVNNFFKRVKRFPAGIFLESLGLKTGIAAQKRCFANLLKVRVFSFQTKRGGDFSLSIENCSHGGVSLRNTSCFRPAIRTICALPIGKY